MCASELIADGDSINLNVVMTSNDDNITVGALGIEMALMKNTRTFLKRDIPASPTDPSPQQNSTAEDFENTPQSTLKFNFKTKNKLCYVIFKNKENEGNAEEEDDEESLEKLELLKSVLSNDVFRAKHSRDTNSNTSMDMTEENNKEISKSANASVTLSESLQGSDSEKSISSVNPPFISNNNMGSNVVGAGKEVEGFGNLEQVTRLEALMMSQLEQHKEQILNYKRIVKDLELELKSEIDWRVKIQMKALVEGGRFVLNRLGEKVNKCVWYSPSSNSIKLADKRVNHKDENDKDPDILSFELPLLNHVEFGINILI